jgi:hypothetical protein
LTVGRDRKERFVSRLSIVIPCLGGAAEFDATLVSVLQNRPPDCEIVVVHTEPYDDPYELTGEVHFLQVESDCLVELLSAALIVARGEVLHIVGCGLEATEGWTDTALTHFDDPDVAAVSPVVMSPDGQSVVAAGIRWSLGGTRRVISDHRILLPGSGRLRARIQGPTLAAAFYRRDVLLALGGFDSGVGDELADVAAALAIEAVGRLHIGEPSSRLIQTRPAAAPRISSFGSGRAAERLFWRAASRRGTVLSLLAHGITVAGEWLNVTAWLGRLSAWCEFGAVEKYSQQLLAAEDRLAEVASLRASIRKKGRRTDGPPAQLSSVRKAA